MYINGKRVTFRKKTSKIHLKMTKMWEMDKHLNRPITEKVGMPEHKAHKFSKSFIVREIQIKIIIIRHNYIDLRISKLKSLQC